MGAVTDLDERYGRRPPIRRRTRWALVALGLALLLGLAVTITAFYVAAQPDASMEVRGYDVVSDEKTTAVVDITKPAGRNAACEVRALDLQLDLVGTLRVEATGPAKHVRLSVTVPTTTRAFGIRAGDCVLE
jgi:hypothetical protein